MITVKIAKLGERIESVALNPGSTVRQALTAAGYDEVPSGHAVKRGADPVDLDAQVEDGNIITLSPKVSAG